VQRYVRWLGLSTLELTWRCLGPPHEAEMLRVSCIHLRCKVPHVLNVYLLSKLFMGVALGEETIQRSSSASRRG